MVFDLGLGQAGGHLVQQQQRGRVASAMPISSSRCCDGVMARGRQVRLRRQADQRPGCWPRQRSSQGPTASCAPRPGKLQAEVDVGRHAHVGKHARRLEGAREAAGGKAVRPLARQACPIRDQLARSGHLHARDGVEEGRLAGAVGADDAHQLARMQSVRSPRPQPPGRRSAR
jgi:hypothetical protein